MLLSDLTAGSRRLALVGLAKNTGKTVALGALLSELAAAGRPVGVTSVGRDGEERDVIDFRIEKPRVLLAPDSLVATTDVLLRESGLAHEQLRMTGVRTPLGQVVIARLGAGGALEVAGPSSAADVRDVSEEMLALGAERVLIDGAVNRRAASSPDVSDGLVISTGAVLSEDLATVVARTRDAFALACLPALHDGEAPASQLQALAGRTVLVGDDGPLELEPRFVLTADQEQVSALLGRSPGGRWLSVAGALPEAFLARLARAARRDGRELTVVVADSTRVFLSERGPDWYARHGVVLRTLHPVSVRAITVNPVAPLSHRFDSAQLRSLLEAAIPDVPVLDVLHPAYRGSQQPAPA